MSASTPHKIFIHIQGTIYAVANHKNLICSFFQFLEIINRRISLPITIIAHAKKHLPKYSGNIVNIHGNQMYLQSDSVELVGFGVLEPLVTEVFEKTVRKGYVVLDIGANIGYYTLIAARKVGVEGRVYAFEPELANFELLRKNVKLNNYRNVVLEKKAVSNKNGTSKLYVDHTSTGGHSLTQKSNMSIQVETVTVDSYFEKMERIDLIKMDIEGAETLVIQGMSDVLNKNKHLKIIMEFDIKAIKHAGFTLRQLTEPLFNQGFRAYVIESGEKIDALSSLKDRFEDRDVHLNLFWYR
jgi:FkbM family methyltransferase